MHRGAAEARRKTSGLSFKTQQSSFSESQRLSGGFISSRSLRAAVISITRPSCISDNFILLILTSAKHSKNSFS